MWNIQTPKFPWQLSWMNTHTQIAVTQGLFNREPLLFRNLLLIALEGSGYKCTHSNSYVLGYVKNYEFGYSHEHTNTSTVSMSSTLLCNIDDFPLLDLKRWKKMLFRVQKWLQVPINLFHFFKHKYPSSGGLIHY